MATFREQLATRLCVLDEVPTFPEIVWNIERAIQGGGTSAQEVAMMIEEDVGISAGVLRLVNSPMHYSSLSGTIVSILDAVVRLGFKEVSQLATTIALIRAFKDTGHHLNPRQFWRHSFVVAVCGRHITELHPGAVKFGEDEAYVAGLLHDVGSLLLDQSFPEFFEQVAAEQRARACTWIEAERVALEMDHGEIGGQLLYQWNLPEAIIEAARWHHQPECAKADYRALADMTYLSEAVCTNLETAGDAVSVEDFVATLPEPCGPVLEGLTLKPTDLPGVIEYLKAHGNPVFACIA